MGQQKTYPRKCFCGAVEFTSTRTWASLMYAAIIPELPFKPALAKEFGGSGVVLSD